MSNYNFGNVDIEFNNNKIFLLSQILYRIESLESKNILLLLNSISTFPKL